MGQSVGGLRDQFYRDLTGDYQDRQTSSTLYQFFWKEGMEELLTESLPRLLSREPVPSESLSELLARDFPDLLPEGELCFDRDGQLTERLGAEMKRRPPEARRLLLGALDGEKRWDFWKRLRLNDAGYQAGLITDTEYYLWLIEYLAAHGSYYKETIKGAGERGKDLSGHRWLTPLLQRAPPRLDRETGKPIRPGWKKREKDGTHVFALAQVERDLKRMAALLREERAAGETTIARRLHDLKVLDREDGGRAADYLPWLTGRLARMALHITIKNWLQYSGYPLLVYDEVEGRKEKKRDRERKNDFSMRLFEAFCDGPEGYSLRRKRTGSAESWQMDGNGFCLLAPDQIDPLLESLRQSGRTYFYLPLAVDLYSGCTFFLAGKENYEEAYESAGEEDRERYEKTRERFCFDYLRLEKNPINMGGAFRMSPAFHKNAGRGRRSYQDVLNAFKRYCMAEKDGPRQMLRLLNEDEPAGIPDPFRGAFE